MEPTTAPAIIPVLEALLCSPVEGSIGRPVGGGVDVVVVVFVVAAVVVSDLSWDLVFDTVTTVVSVVRPAVLVLVWVGLPVSKLKVASPVSIV